MADAAIDALRDQSESELRAVNGGLFSAPSAQDASVTNQSRPPTAEAEQIKRALERAASRARELAQRTGTPCYVIRDGRMVDAARGNACQATPDSAR
jgi:hypothetical protein